MSKRNFILLIIVLIIIVFAVFGFLYFVKNPSTPVNNSTGTNFYPEPNPFGNGKSNTNTTTPPADVSGYVAPNTNETQKLQLVKISTMPIAGFTIFTKERLKENTTTPVSTGIQTTPVKKPTTPKTELATALRYVAKATGNIYQTFIDKINEQKFSSTIIPKVYDAFFGNHGMSVIMRHLKGDDRTIETFVGTLPKETLGVDTTGNNEIKGSFLADNIKDISLSPDNLKMFYLFTSLDSSYNESITGTILNFATNKKVQIFNSLFTEWLSQWPTNNIITLSTKPSSTTPGYTYSIDGSGKNISQVLGNTNGLTTLTSPNGKLVLYGDNGLSLDIFHTDTKNSDTLGLKTLPEKCVWGKASDVIYCAVPKSIDAGQYPDSWYQGEVSFKDDFWKIDVKTGNTTLIVNPTTVVGGEEVDGTKLAIDDGGNYLFFVNKKDSFLWRLNLK